MFFLVAVVQVPLPTLLLCRLLPLAPALPPFLSPSQPCQLWSQPRSRSALFLFEFGFIIQQSSREKVFVLVCSAYMDDVNGLIQCPAVTFWKSFLKKLFNPHQNVFICSNFLCIQFCALISQICFQLFYMFATFSVSVSFEMMFSTGKMSGKRKRVREREWCINCSKRTSGFLPIVLGNN